MSVCFTINQNIIEMEYAVRGPIPQRAAELQKQGKKTIPCNIGNPQALGQQPITFYRQVLSLIEQPALLQREKQLRTILKSNPALQSEFEDSFVISDYVLEFTEKLLSNLKSGVGAYTESKGPQFIREAIAAFIDQRDVGEASGRKSNPDSIFLTNGASEGAKYIIDMLVAKRTDGIMIPTPQYPLYSATIRKIGGTQVNYYPDEDAGWLLNTEILEEAIAGAKRDGVTVKAIVVINPGNPTGAILDEESIRGVIAFAKAHKLAIIADEVYQENTYGAKFSSFAKIMGDENEVPLFSLHSASKGFYGECGHRGGYLEVRNPPEVESGGLSFMEILLKQASVSLCSNTIGQVLTYLMVNPPEKGSEPHALYIREKENILNDLHEKAVMVKEAFKEMDGVECFGRIGAMYLFPRLNKLPQGKTDFDYCMSLLEKTGLTTVNGSGFGQKEGTSHLRIAFLPPKAMLKQVLPEWIAFHNAYVNR